MGMTVREYLSIHNTKHEDIHSVGIYKNDGNGTIIDNFSTPISIIDHLDREIDHVNLGIFDEVKHDIYGKEYVSHYIRACIYVKE